MTDARTTQVGLEHWSAPVANAQATQVGLEHWASVPSVTVRALVTSVALEHWARPAAAAPPGGPMITMVM